MFNKTIALVVSALLSGMAVATPVLTAEPALARSSKALSSHENLDVDLGISELPSNVEAFLALRERLAKTPEGAVAVFLVALNVYGENRDLGKTFLTIAVDARHVKDSEEPGSYKGKIINKNRTREFNRVLENSPNTARAYWKGAGPDNGYKADKPFAAKIYKVKGTEARADKYAEATTGRAVEELKLFVMSEGYRNASGGGRPISVAKNAAGVWKVTRFSGVVAAVMKTPGPTDDL